MRFLFITLFFITITNSYAINWTKEFNGTSSSEKINLSDGRTVSHYKNSGNWQDSFGNYGTQKLKMYEVLLLILNSNIYILKCIFWISILL